MTECLGKKKYNLTELHEGVTNKINSEMEPHVTALMVEDTFVESGTFIVAVISMDF